MSQPPPPPQWTPPPAPGAPMPGLPAPGYAYVPMPRTEGFAVAALVLSIVAFFMCPVIGAVLALVFAHLAGNRIDASGGMLRGEGMVRAAQIVAWVHLGLILVGLAIAVAWGAANGGDFTTDTLRSFHHAVL